MNIFEKMQRFVNLAAAARAIEQSGAEPEVIYDLIFSDEISGAIQAMGLNFSYYDPDTTYEEDVRAFVQAVSDPAERYRLALSMGGESDALERRAYNAGFAAGSASDERLQQTYEEWKRSQ